MEVGIWRWRDNATAHASRPRSTHSAFEGAIEQVSQTLPIEVPLVIEGKERFRRRSLDRRCPSDTSRKVADVALAGDKEGDKAAEVAMQAWPS